MTGQKNKNNFGFFMTTSKRENRGLVWANPVPDH